MDQRDEDLMAQVAQGDSKPLERLVRRHASGLLTVLVRMVADRHHAEELFQDVFLTVWRKRHQYQHPRPFRSWLYAIALNRARAVMRLKTPRPSALLDDNRGEIMSPDERLLASETADEIARAVAGLPDQQRAVVVLRVWQELPYSRIADLVGCTEATARSHMHHGLATLRTVLDPRVAGERLS